MKKISFYLLPIFLTLALTSCENDKSFLVSSNNLKNLPSLKFSQPAEPLPEKNFSYELNTNISFAGKFNVYKLVDKKINKNQFIELSNKLEIFPSEKNILYNKETHTYSYKTETYSFAAQQKGIFTYSINKNSNKDKSAKIAPFSDEDTEKAAKDYLSKLNLLPEGSFISSISTNPSADNKIVVFNVKTNDKPILGAVKIEVFVGTEGKIQGLSSHVSNYALLGKKDLRNVQVAINDLKSNKGFEYFKNGVKPVKCCIDKVELCYFEDSNIEDQPYLYPVYKMTGFTFDDKGTKYEYTGIVQAIE